MAEALCPCHSGKLYGDCCKPFHDGILPKNALQLMRSRYSAYALGLMDYLIDTTHSSHPKKMMPLEEWKKQIVHFSNNTTFVNLSIQEFVDGTEEAYVTFFADLRQEGKDSSFTERSRFLKENGKWFYVDGVFQPNKKI